MLIVGNNPTQVVTTLTTSHSHVFYLLFLIVDTKMNRY